MKLNSLMPTLTETVLGTVKQSFQNFADDSDLCNLETLSSELASHLTAGLQQALLDGGKAGLKSFLENYDCPDPVIFREPADSPTPDSLNLVVYTFKTISPKKFLTVFGEIEINRRLYCHWKGGPARAPLDEAWNMQGRYATPEVTEAMLFSASMLSPGEISELFAKTGPFQPSASLVQDIINQDGAAITKLLEQPDLEEEARPFNLPNQPIKALVVSMDGANVLVREPGKKRGRPAERPGTENKPTEDQTSSCSYKNAMIGSFSLYGEPAEVIDIKTGKPVLQPNRLQSIYEGQMPESKAHIFKARCEQTIRRTEEKLPDGVARILLMDGARSLWNYVEDNPIYHDFLFVVDYFHASEHLSHLSEALFGKSSSEAQEWYELWKRKLKHEENSVSNMLRSAKRYQQSRKRTKEAEKQVETEMGYFKRNQSRMSYADLTRLGLPIGSGPVEAGCKMIVKTRFCRSGMRWSREGGQNVMNLRVVQKSGQWESLWNSYQKAGSYQSFQGERLPQQQEVAA